jgi:ribosomal protein S18 acetylase RimI-like enzyme
MSGALRPLRFEAERQASDALARAFVDDPLVIAICGEDAPLRARRIWWSFRVAVRSHCQLGHPAWCIAGENGGLSAVALVIEPQAPRTIAGGGDWWFSLRALFSVGFGAGMRGIEAAQTIAAHEPRYPFTYLRTLGVDPAHQRHGLGSALVEQVIRRAAVGPPIYLETAREQNISFYARHGFDRCGEFRCLGVPVWRLLRDGR